MAVMLPLFSLAMYEKDGQLLEVVAKHFYEAKFKRPKTRPYKTKNYYALLVQQADAEMEVNRIVQNVDANGIAEAVHAVVPNVIHQLLLTHGPPLMHHQVFEYPRFLSGQRQRLPIDGGGAGAGVEAQASAA